MISEPYPDLTQLLQTIGEAGSRLSDIEASEGAAGNISVCLRWPIEVRNLFPVAEPFDLPQPAPMLAGATIVVSGSGRRLRELHDDPVSGVGCVVLDDAGHTATLFTAPSRHFARVTSEFNSHLAVHADQVERSGSNFHAVIHAQPMRLTYLSHLEAYQNTLGLNRRLLRWQPELIVQLPQGICYLPFEVPGSSALMSATVTALRSHRVVVWAKHGVMARSDMSVKNAADRVEYAETAAKYEYLDLAAGGHGQGLSDKEILRVCDAFDVRQDDLRRGVAVARGPLSTSIWLCGLMGSGRSTLGTAAAMHFGIPFVDNDATIADFAGCSTVDLALQSKEVLHRWEARYVQQLAQRADVVVAGIAASSADRPDDLTVLKASGFLVYLRCDVATLAERVRKDPRRPLLDERPEGLLTSMFDRRDPILRQAAHLVIAGSEPVREQLRLLEAAVGT